MFDSKEVAEKALLRIEQLNKAKRRKRLRLVLTGATMCIYAAWLLLLMTDTDYEMIKADMEPPDIYIEEPAIPLARPPTVPTAICPECGEEIQEEQEKEHCCHCETDE